MTSVEGPDRGGALGRYLCIGAICFGMNWTLMLLIDRDRYLASSAICFVLVGSFAYVCHALWTFQAPLEVWRWLAYLLGSAPGYPLSLALIALLHDAFGISLFWSLPMATLLMLGVNFAVARLTVVRRRPPRHSGLQATSDI